MSEQIDRLPGMYDSAGAEIRSLWQGIFPPRAVR